MAKTYGVVMFSFNSLTEVVKFDDFKEAKAFFNKVVRKRSSDCDLGKPDYKVNKHEFTQLPYAEWVEVIMEGKVIIQMIEILSEEEGKDHFLMNL